jgi:hypothetical protein
MAKGNGCKPVPGLRDLVAGDKVHVLAVDMQLLAEGVVTWVHERATCAVVKWISPDGSCHKRSFFLRSGREISDAGDRHNCILANRAIRPVAAQ